MLAAEFLYKKNCKWQFSEFPGIPEREFPVALFTIHDPPTSQTYGQTDRQTLSDSKTALCTLVHHAVIINIRFQLSQLTSSYYWTLNNFLSFDILGRRTSNSMRLCIAWILLSGECPFTASVRLHVVQIPLDAERITRRRRHWPLAPPLLPSGVAPIHSLPFRCNASMSIESITVDTS